MERDRFLRYGAKGPEQFQHLKHLWPENCWRRFRLVPSCVLEFASRGRRTHPDLKKHAPVHSGLRIRFQLGFASPVCGNLFFQTTPEGSLADQRKNRLANYSHRTLLAQFQIQAQAGLARRSAISRSVRVTFYSQFLNLIAVPVTTDQLGDLRELRSQEIGIHPV